MKTFEEFRNGILGKIYRKRYSYDKIHIVVDVCGRKESSEINAKITTAHVIFLSISVPNESITTSFYCDKESVSIGTTELNFNRQDSLDTFKESYYNDPDYNLQNIVDYYKTFNANVKDLLRSIGAEF